MGFVKLGGIHTKTRRLVILIAVTIVSWIALFLGIGTTIAENAAYSNFPWYVSPPTRVGPILIIVGVVIGFIVPTLLIRSDIKKRRMDSTVLEKMARLTKKSYVRFLIFALGAIGIIINSLAIFFYTPVYTYYIAYSYMPNASDSYFSLLPWTLLELVLGIVLAVILPMLLIWSTLLYRRITSKSIILSVE